jgi:hypothetical protein
MGRFTILLLFSCLIISKATAQVTVNGFSGGNTDTPVQLFKQLDPISGRELFISAIVPDSEGRFSFTIENEDVSELFIRSGVHNNHFFIEGSENISLILHPYTPLSATESRNPFFEYQNVLCASSDTSDLNNRILRIENIYSDAYEEILSAPSIDKADSVGALSVLQIGETIISEQSTFIHNWGISRIASLKLLLVRDLESRREIVKSTEASFDPANRANVEMVNDVFSKLLRELSVASDGSIVRSTLNGRKLFTELQDFAISESGINNRRMIEYILLKNLYTEYYSTYFSREGCFNMIRWMGRNGTYEFNRTMAVEIGDRIARLLPGSPIPDFAIGGEEEKLYTPSQSKGKFLLITFGLSDSWLTISEFSLIKRWIELYGDHLEVVTILCDNDYSDAVRRMTQNGFSWKMVDGSSDRSITDLYEVRFYPSFFLADPDGTIIRAHAPMPSENLQQILLEELRPYLINNLPE